MLKGPFVYIILNENLQEELQSKTGIDLKQEMAKKLKEMEVQWRKEKEEANETFQQERKVIYWHVITYSINIFTRKITSSHLLYGK